MKIVKKRSNILDLQLSEINYSNLLSLVVVASMFAITGVFILLQKESVILDCERLESNYVNCNIIRYSLVGKKTVNFPQLKKAEIKKIDRQDTTGYRINLIGSMGKVSLKRNYIYNESKSKNQVNEINNFLKNNSDSNPYFKLEYHESFLDYIGGFLSLVVGIIMGWCIFMIIKYFHDTNFIFDKETNTLWRVEKNLFATKKLFYLPLSDITKAEVMKSQKIDDDEPTNVYNVYHLVLKKRSCSISLKAEEIDENGMIVLTSDTIEIMEEIIKNHIILKADGIENNKNQYTEIKDEINDFLGKEN